MNVERVGVVGAGVMGAGIAQVLATAGCEVAIFDTEPAARATLRERVEHGRFGLRAVAERGKLTGTEIDAALARIEVVDALEDACAGIQLAVEAVPEDVGLKVRVFRALDRLAPAEAVLTSNSAGLPIAAFAQATDRPAQVLGWHWAQPTAVTRFAELVVHPGTSPEAIATVREAATRCGKSPQVVNDFGEEWGYVANRIYRAIRREARRVVEDGVATPEVVDALMRDCFRWAMGPFELDRTTF